MPAAQPASPTEPSPKEQRKSTRAGLLMQVECEATGASSLGRSQDVSEGGLLLLTGDTFDVQASVVVRFHIPPYPPGAFIEVPGVVVRVEPGESMGIQFLELKDHQRKAIANFVQQAETGSEK